MYLKYKCDILCLSIESKLYDRYFLELYFSWELDAVKGGLYPLSEKPSGMIISLF